ncbi:MAG: thioesterase family protein [Sandaracinaceae bacterium]
MAGRGEAQLESDTRLVPRSGCGPGRARFDAVVSDRWSIGTAPNGGYLAVLVARAMAEALPHKDPFSITLHFLRIARPGPACIEVEVVRVGRGHSTAEARLIQEGAEVVRALATFGELGRSDGPTVVRAVAPPIPPRDACNRGRAGPTPDLSIAERVDMFMAPGTVTWVSGEKSDVAELGGWARFSDGRPTDALSLLFFADAFPPPVLNLRAASAPWVPTLELTVHLKARPSPGWIRGWFRTRALVGGYLEEDGELWDEEERLVAISRQLARLHRP